MPTNGFYANQCESVGIVDAVKESLPGRYVTKENGDGPSLPGQPVQTGLYVLGLHATPLPECLYAPLDWLAPRQEETQSSVMFARSKGGSGWYLTDQYSTQKNLNIVSLDFVESYSTTPRAVLLNLWKARAPGTIVQPEIVQRTGPPVSD
jgi:hypothetical protein